MLYEMYKKEFGNRLKEARKKAGLTQVELAERVGCFQVEIANWENGVRKPQEKTIQALAKILKVNATYLNLGSGEADIKKTNYGSEITLRHIKNNEPTKLSPKYKELSADELHAVNELIDVFSTLKK